MAFINPKAVEPQNTTPVAPSAPQAAPEKSVAIVYGTTSGNSKMVAEAVCDGLDSKGVKAEVMRAEKSDAKEVAKYAAMILVCSTWNVGQLNDNFVKFNDELKKLKLLDKEIEVVGLGDSKNYDIFCGSADILEETVKTVGGKQLMKTVKLDGPVEGLLGDMKKWGTMLADKINA